MLSLRSTSAASDGAYLAIHEISPVLAGRPSRLIGGAAVLLHQERLGLTSLPIRATADADFGVPPIVLRDESVISAIGTLGYSKVEGNRWVRDVGGGLTATIDLLVPTYRSRARSSVQVGAVNTTEVKGLAEALKRPSVRVRAEVALLRGDAVTFEVELPDVASTLAMKLYARTARAEDRDALDAYTCLEALAAEGDVDDFAAPVFGEPRSILAQEFADDGPATAIVLARFGTADQARIATRLRGLVRAIAG
jgi:hypothetical protein